MKFLTVLWTVSLLSVGYCLKPSRVGQVVPTGTPGSISGLVFLLNHTAIYIRDFSFTLGGTDGVFCAGASTTDTSDAFEVPSGESPLGAPFSSPDVELTLPSPTTVAELAWFGVCDSTQVTSVLASVVILPQVVSNVPCETTFLGELPAGSNSLAGRVYLLNRVTFAVVGFSYDGEEIDSFFWVGAGVTPSINGFPCTYGDGIVTRLPALEDQDLVVSITANGQGTEVTYLAIWCRTNNFNLGHILVPEGLIPATPTPIISSFTPLLGVLANGQHGVRGNVFAVGERRLMLTNFFYDGTAPGAVFYAVRGPSVFSSETWIIPDENGNTNRLRAYTDSTIVITLPDEITVHTIDWFSVWCLPFRISFEEIPIPDVIVLEEVEIPTLEPIEVCQPLTSQIPVNCKNLNDDITMSWVIDSTNDIIAITLCGCVLPDNYIAFGISGSDDGVLMFGGDVTWTWLDNEGVHAGDLDLTAYEQCLMTQSEEDGSISQRGACPDVQDDVTSVSGFREDCTTCIKFARPLVSSDATDRPFLLDQEQFVIWSMGPVSSLVTPLSTTIPVPFRHFIQPSRTDDLRVNFSRSPVDECSLQCSDCEVALEPWDQPVLEHTTTITCQIGQSGGERGYTGITGTAGWGIAWYLNGLLIPSVTVFRGVTYTFITEGGINPDVPSFYHPFYITDSERGGYLAKSEADQQQETVYAGIDTTTNTPFGVGRYCEYQNIAEDRSQEFTSFQEYTSTLRLDCTEGEAGRFTWTPSADTPDVVYYQCATHQFLGWQIQVQDLTAPQTPMVLSVEPAGDGDVDVIIEIPSDPNFVVPQGMVTFTVTVSLASTGEIVATPSTVVNNYRYGDDVTVSVPNLVIGQDYVFTVTASNSLGTSEPSGETMPIEVEDTPPPKDNRDAIIGGAVGGALVGVLLFSIAAVAIIAFVITKTHHSDKGYFNRSSRMNSMKVAIELDATYAEKDPPVSQNVTSKPGSKYP